MEEYVSSRNGGRWDWSQGAVFFAIREALEPEIEFSNAWMIWAEDPSLPLEIGHVLAGLADHFGATSPNLLLSAETYAKQVAHHPELQISHYAFLPRLLMEGEGYVTAGHKVRLVWELGSSGFEANVKVTAKGELFLVSFFLAKRSRVEKTRRNCRRVQ